jgi:methylated-DNA-[protein]-cysteine S-methyltransferase
MTQLLVSTFETCLGWTTLAGSTVHGPKRGAAENGPLVLRRVAFGFPTGSAAREHAVGNWPGETRDEQWHPDLEDRLMCYADGEAMDFDDVAVDLNDFTPFARQVLGCCRRIPYGRRITYRELAEQAGSPNAARAVGNVMASNRFPLIIPCHRVVASGGGLGGYSAPNGLSLKERLLEMEAAAVPV